jgi:uncharacterized membrane protein YedE/YeeE
MTIVNFTPISALAGGALIGLAAAGMWWLLGRIAGVSSVLGNAIGARGADLAWRLAFIAGLLVSGMLAATVFPGAVHFQMEAGYTLAVAAGLLVGVGTNLGGGCTSGHGVCGVSRLSRRSIVATSIFMASGFLVVFIARHLL